MNTFDILAEQLLSAKADETAAKKLRIAAEQAIIDAMPAGWVPDEGSKTIDAGNGVKITVTQPVARKVDVKAYEAMVASAAIPPEMNPVAVTATYRVNAKTARGMAISNPQAWAWWAQCITETPGKPSIKIKVAQ